MITDNSQYEKNDQQLAIECNEIINTLSLGSLLDFKKKAIFDIYKERYTKGGMQLHHYQEIIKKIKPIIIATNESELIKSTIRRTTELYKKQKWEEVRSKLEVFRNA
jgi:hypothetical protein